MVAQQERQGTGTETPSPDIIALAIFDDLFTSEPTYDYDLAAAGKYARQLQMLIPARKNGLEIANRVLKAIVARPDSELAVLLKKQEASVESNGLKIPTLPPEIQLPEDCLPRALDDPQKDWFARWDSSRLRSISPFLADYIAYSNRFSPEGHVDFHLACALWTLSTVAARRICVPLSQPVYTPLAIALVARTSLFAKSSTAFGGVKALNAAGLGWMLGDDETTPQSLIQDMSGWKVPSNYAHLKPDEQAAVENQLTLAGQRGWYYDEFNQLINAMTRQNGPMIEFAGLFRKLDNCPETYRYSTKGDGRYTIKKPYLAFLASTTPANLLKHASKGGEFWNDGFWARFWFICPPQNEWCTKTMNTEIVPVPPSISKALREWHERLGMPQGSIIDSTDMPGKFEFQMEEDLPEHAIELKPEAYNAYKKYREALRNILGNSNNMDLDGNYVRASGKALATAALIAGIEGKKCIDMPIWTLAQEISEMFRRNLHNLYDQVGGSLQEGNPLEDALIEHLKKLGKPTTVRELANAGPNKIRKLGSKGIEDLLKFLQKSGIVEMVQEGKRECWKFSQ
jgi:hypothetical protein